VNEEGSMALSLRVALAFLLVGSAWASRGYADSKESARKTRTAPVNFAREVRPILSDNCFACHGPDDKARKAGLRLDIKEGAFGGLKSGGKAIVPGQPDESELVFRVENEDPEARMPPRKSGKHLTAEQAAVLRRWVEQGASWATHWAFEPPRTPALPVVRNTGWPGGAVDRFILARLEAEGLSPEPEAEKTTLIRRVTLDLTGLPPALTDVEAFLADRSPGAYARVIDRLLASPRYGEQMARFWLDAARYGDTHGLHLDNYREIWPYRDWVIRAFNANMPFNRFVIEQLAGDLLPHPTLDQIVATGFNRCHVSTNEGGAIEEEVYVRNIVDQVDTNGTVFMGLSTGCARCHDHKYDPIRMKDYYQLFAFFNNIDGPPMDGNSARFEPTVRVPTAAQRRALEAADAAIAAVRRTIAAETAKAAAAYDPKTDGLECAAVPRADFVWIDDALPAGARPQSPWEFVSKPDHPVYHGRRALRVRARGLDQQFFEGASAKLKIGADDVLFAHVYIDKSRRPRELMLQWHTAGGWAHRAYWGANLINWGKDGTPERLRMGELPASAKWVRLEVPAARLKLAPGTLIDGWAFTQHGGVAYWDHAGITTQTPQDGQLYDSLTAWVRAEHATGGAGLPENLKAIIALDRAKWSDEQTKQLRDYFVAHAYTKTHEVPAPLSAKLAELETKRDQIEEKAPTTLVFREKPGEPKPAFLLKRGEYDRRGEQIGRALPAFLPPLPPGAPVNRLGLAQWLVAANHPLTSRVAVNRFWLALFGTGIVRTVEDFGAQGEPPSHPELLDWLAVQFREDGWDVKKLMKRLVMSAAYRQSSRLTPERLARDPANRLLSRGPRYRLDAEMLRDQALAVSGLLVEHLGGPSVKPPQPSGLWEAVGYTASNTARFVPDHGVEKVHRRSLYIFWKRTAAPPQMTTFDAPSREMCTMRRERTNTPLQALLLLNEPQFVEAARALAERTLREAGSTDEERLSYLFQSVTARCPDAADLAELRSALKDLTAHYASRPDAARALIATGETKPDPHFDPGELAPWTVISNVVLNLDEVIGKG
jgi:hypothetical protein